MRLVTGLLAAGLLLLATAAANAATVCARLDPFATLLRFEVTAAGEIFTLAGFDLGAADRLVYGTARVTPTGARVAFSIVGDQFARHINANLGGSPGGPFTASDGSRGTLTVISCPPAGIQVDRAPDAARDAVFVSSAETAGVAFDANGTKIGTVVSVIPLPSVILEVGATRFALQITEGGFQGEVGEVLYAAVNCQGAPLVHGSTFDPQRLLQRATVIGSAVYVPQESGSNLLVVYQSTRDPGGCINRGDPGPNPSPNSVRPAVVLDVSQYVPPFEIR